jgi:serine/threonine protein kinase/WD40 repeat protein
MLRSVPNLEAEGQESNGGTPIANSKSEIPNQIGDYELLEEIGRGGMGVVYRARQRSLNRVVAIKMMAFGPGSSPELVKRFRTEAVSAASLHHPNIVAIHEVGIHEDRHFFVMDYVEGQSLARLVGHQPLPAKRAAAYLKTVAEAVHYAHDRGILHRDLKPSNVLIDEEDHPHVVDFGLAKRLDDSQLSTLNPQLTLTGQVLGSPHYLPPEQAAGQRGRVSRRTDVYALGATLYHLLSGRPPFQTESLAQTLDLVLHAEPVAPRLLNPSVPRDLETICLKCLEKEPSRRYDTAQELAEELARFQAGEPIQARPLGPAGKAWRWCRRKPQVASLAATAALLLVFGVSGVLWQWRQAESERQRAGAGELLARQNAYAADMKEVQRALEESDLGRARELLDRHRPAGKSEIRNPKSEVDLRGWEWRYFWSQCESDEWFTFCRCSNAVSALAFSADGQWLAVGQDGGTIALWDAVARRPMPELPDYGQDKALAFSPRGNLLGRGGRDTNGAFSLTIMDASVRKEIASLPLPAGLRSVAFSPDAKLIAALSRDGSVRVCEVASQQVVTQFLTASLDRLSSPFTAPSATRSSPGEALVARGGLGRQARTRVWPTSNLFVSHYGSVLFSPDGRWLAVGEAAPRIRLLDRARGEERAPLELPPPADAITTLAFSPDGRLLAAGGGVLDHDVHVWDLVAGTELRLSGHSGWVAALAFSPDGNTLASASADQTVRLWDVGRKVERRRFRGSADEIWALAWSPDGKSLVTGGRDGAVRYWDPAAKPAAVPCSTLPALIYPYAIAFSPDSRFFLTAARPEGNVLRWDTAALQVVEMLVYLGTNHNSLALSQDARWLALGDAAGQVQVWDLPARRFVTNLVFDGVVAALKFSPRDQMLFGGGLSSEGWIIMKLWKVAGWEEMNLGRIDLKRLSSAVFSPDERLLGVGYEGGKAAWWDLASGKREAWFDCRRVNGGSEQIAFSPDGRMFATAGFSGGLMLWDVANLQPRPVGRAYRNLLYRIAFSPDGRRVIATGSLPQGVLRLWDVETGRDVAALPAGPGTYNLFFSPDANTLCAVSMEEGLVLLWRAPSFAEIELKEKEKRAERRTTEHDRDRQAP